MGSAPTGVVRQFYKGAAGDCLAGDCLRRILVATPRQPFSPAGAWPNGSDTAYGGSQMRNEIRSQLGVKLLTPPVSAPPAQDGKISRVDFTVNFDAGTVTCPNGVETSDYNKVQHPQYGEPTRRYKWPKDACAACPVSSGCHLGVRTGHRLLLHPFEKDLREHRSEWEDKKVRTLYRRRGEFERLNNEVTRHGGRRARSWGLTAANLQAHAIVIVCNLRLLAMAVCKMEMKATQVNKAAA